MTSVLYLATRFLYRLTQFLNDWYVASFSALAHRATSILERYDRSLALRVTLRHMFEPLYQDRSVIGYILGFIFRTVRICIALVAYAIVILVFVTIYALWASVPLLLIYFILTNHGIA